MRILVTVHPGFAHFHLAVSPVKQFISMGHEVVFVSAPSFVAEIEKRGFRAIGAGEDWSLSQVRATLPELAHVPHSELGVALMQLWLGRLGTSFAEDIVSIISSEKPDLLLVDSTDFGGRVAGEVCQISTQYYSIGLRFPPELLAHFFEKPYTKLRSHFGLSTHPDQLVSSVYQGLIYNILPPSWFPTDTHHILPQDVFCRFQDESRLISDVLALPEDVEDAISAGKTIVHASLGTVVEDDQVITTIIDSFRNREEVLVLTLKRPIAIPNGVPDNVIVCAHIPHHLLLPHCDVMISHGGFNSALVSLMHGVPTILLPFGFDHPEVARFMSAQGVGLTIPGSLKRSIYGEMLVDPSQLKSKDIAASLDSILARQELLAKRLSASKQALQRNSSSKNFVNLCQAVSTCSRIRKSMRLQKSSAALLPVSMQFGQSLRVGVSLLLDKGLGMLKKPVLDFIEEAPEGLLAYTDLFKFMLAVFISNVEFAKPLIPLLLRMGDKYWQQVLFAEPEVLQPLLRAIASDITRNDMRYTSNGIVKAAAARGFSKQRREWPIRKYSPPHHAREIAIVVPVKDNQAGICKFLDSLLSNTPSEHYPSQVIIVDNNSKPALALDSRFSAFPFPISVVQESMPGAGAARNAGVAAILSAKSAGPMNIAVASGSAAASSASDVAGKWVLFLDSDCIVTPTTISGYIGLPFHAAAYQGHISAYTDDWVSRFYIDMFEEMIPEWLDRQSVSFAITANLLVNVEAFRRIGGFDVSFKSAGGEDFELGSRLMRNSEIRLVRSTVVKHDYLGNEKEGDITVKGKHILEFLSRYQRYGFWNTKVVDQHGKIRICRSNEDYIYNICTWLYAKHLGLAYLQGLLRQMRSQISDPVPRMSSLELRIMMFNAMQDGERQAEEKGVSHASMAFNM